jgi:hypothetical protein
MSAMMCDVKTRKPFPTRSSIYGIYEIWNLWIIWIWNMTFGDPVVEEESEGWQRLAMTAFLSVERPQVTIKTGTYDTLQ